jgi:hypothetical protein
METNGNEQPLLDVVLRFFVEEQWNFKKIDQKPVIRAGFRGEHGTWVCYATVEEDHRRILFHSYMGMNIPFEYRAQVVEYLNRVNYCLALGNFEMDMETGDVRFRTSLEAPEGDLGLAFIRAMAYGNVHTMDHYFPGIVAVMNSGLSPEAALARVEAQSEEGIPDQ